jgi:phenylacetate-coenzyme A ligase PaaK-like adenylate-forming protein
MADLNELRAAHAAMALAGVPEHIERVSWDDGTLAAHRERALHALLKVAGERSPWHRARLVGVATDAVTPDDLTALPTMTKRDVMAHFDDIVTDPRVRLAEVEAHLATAADGGYLFDEYTPLATGGSTGRRMVMVFDRRGLADWWLSVFRCMFAWRAADAELSRRQMVVCWVTASHPSHVSAALARTFNAPGFQNVSLPVTLPWAQIVDGLNAAQPDLVIGYPTALLRLTMDANAGRLRISPGRVMSAGEPLLPEVRAVLERTWPGQLGNRWASTEGGAHTATCDAGFEHVAEDQLILEPVDEHNRPVPPGTRSAKVLLTNLFNAALPLIRYEISDEVTVLPGDCPCGSPTMRIADIQGRADDIFVYAGAHIHPHVFRSVLGRRPQVIEYRVRQTSTGADVDICRTGELDVAELREELEHGLAAAGLPGARVQVCVRSGPLDRSAETGKFKRFVPLAVTA